MNNILRKTILALTLLTALLLFTACENTTTPPPAAPAAALHLAPFEPGSATTTLTVDYAGSWRILTPDWMTASPGQGTGPNSVAVTIKTGITPDLYTGDILLIDGDAQHAITPVSFAFPQLKGIITGDWTNPQTLTAAAAEAEAEAPPTYPNVVLGDFPTTSGTLLIIYSDDAASSAADTLTTHPATRTLTLAANLSTIILSTDNQQATVAYAQTHPGFLYAETDAPLNIQFETTHRPGVDQDGQYAWSEEDYFGWKWAGEIGGHIHRTNTLNAWKAGWTGKGITVAVFDTGFYLEHQAFKHTNFIGMYPGDGKTGMPPAVSSPLSCLGEGGSSEAHATAVTSAIAGAYAEGHDGPGIAPDASIIVIPLADQSTGSNGECIQAASSSIVSISDWLINNGQRRADIVNTSWYTTESPILEHAFSRMHDAGIITVGGAGNLEGDRVQFPASHKGSIAVAGFHAFTKTPYRSYSTGEVHLMGVEPLNHVPVKAGYQQVGGTSLASPQVTGAVALMLQAKPGATAAEIKLALANSAHKIHLPVGVTHDQDGGYGVLDVHGAIQALLNPNYVPGHQIQLSLNGELLTNTTVRPDGSYNLGYVPLGEITLSASTPQASAMWGASRTFTAKPGVIHEENLTLTR